MQLINTSCSTLMMFEVAVAYTVRPTPRPAMWSSLATTNSTKPKPPMANMVARPLGTDSLAICHMVLAEALLKRWM